MTDISKLKSVDRVALIEAALCQALPEDDLVTITTDWGEEGPMLMVPERWQDTHRCYALYKIARELERRLFPHVG